MEHPFADNTFKSKMKPYLWCFYCMLINMGKPNPIEAYISSRREMKISKNITLEGKKEIMPSTLICR